jgi:hypothetical protein
MPLEDILLSLTIMNTVAIIYLFIKVRQVAKVNIDDIKFLFNVITFAIKLLKNVNPLNKEDQGAIALIEETLELYKKKFKIENSK